MNEIENIIDDMLDVRVNWVDQDAWVDNVPEIARAIEQHIQKRLYESNELKNKRGLIEARIEELENIFKLSMDCNTAEQFGFKVNDYCKRIAELKKQLTKEQVSNGG